MATTATPNRFKVQRNRFTRLYELDSIEQVTDDVAVVKARPVYKNGSGRPRTVGYLKLTQ